MDRLPLALLLATALLAGCSSPAAPDDAADPGPALTGTLAPTPAAPSAPALPPPVTATCDVTRTNAGTGLGYGVYLDRALSDNGLAGPTSCRLDDLFPDGHDWANSALVEVEWTPGPGMTAGDAWIESSACQSTPLDPCPAPYGSSASSPLALAVEGDDYALHAPADLAIQVAAEGLAAQQAFHVTVTLFANATVDDGFSAVG